MDAPVREAPVEDRPNPHAGMRIGEASLPGPPTIAGTHRSEATRHDRKTQRSAGKNNPEERRELVGAVFCGTFSGGVCWVGFRACAKSFGLTGGPRK
eukprot:246544-Heterocapsa_arctica.AAC.1